MVVEAKGIMEIKHAIELHFFCKRLGNRKLESNRQNIREHMLEDMVIYYGDFNLIPKSEALKPSVCAKKHFLFIQDCKTGNSFHRVHLVLREI